MGQYFLTVNLDKREFLHPHKFGDGLKLLEFGLSGMGTLAGLAILLAAGNNRGGGDLRSAHPLIGSWAGDRIVVTGDYADAGQFLEDEDLGILEPAYHTYLADIYPEYRAKYEEIEQDEGVRAAALAAINLYSYVQLPETGYRDISIDVLVALADDDYFRVEWEKRLGPDRWYDDDWATEYRAARAAWLREQADPVPG